MSRTIVDITGEIHKGWKVLNIAEPITKNTSKSKWWLCKCVNCGDEKVFNGSEIRLDRIGQCRCTKKKNKISKPEDFYYGKSSNIKNEIGNRYSYLTVTSFAYTKDGFAYWNCICDCGNTIVCRGNDLRTKHITSCGCLRSRQEYAISLILTELNINFKREYSFKDLYDKNLLRFDFAIFSNNNQLLGLIEYQGIQHYQPYKHFDYKTTVYHDLMKKRYCIQNNIPLLILNKDNVLSKDIREWLISIGLL